MTYCVAMRLDEGLVFLADSRTNAGVDHVSTFRKLTVFERPGERVIVLMTSGNLATGQAVRQIVSETRDADVCSSICQCIHEKINKLGGEQISSLG